MSPESETLLVRELRRIRIAFVWVAVAVIAGAGVITFGLIYSFGASVSVPAAPVTDVSKGPCAGEMFYNSVSALLDRANYKEAITASDERLKTCPADHYAWFYKAKALAIEKQWDAALDALSRAELLRPDWRYFYTKPLRESIEWNKSRTN
jgi:tetratricopeptide (TPR) repeat protein